MCRAARWTGAAAYIMMALLFRTTQAADKPEQPPRLPHDVAEAADKTPKQPPHLPHDVICAWRAVGAASGWMGVSDAGILAFTESLGEAKPEWLPAFQFRRFPGGKVPGLPAPSAPFALDLGGADISDAEVKEIVGLKQLQTLDLIGSRLTDAGLKELAGLPQLRTLDLTYAKVTDAGLKELSGLRHLQWFDLSFTDVADAGLKALALLPELETLDLSYTKVTNAGVKDINGLKKLKVLHLRHTKITAASFADLAQSKQLQWLFLHGTMVGDEEVNQLRKRLSKTAISH